MLWTSIFTVPIVLCSYGNNIFIEDKDFAIFLSLIVCMYQVSLSLHQIVTMLDCKKCCSSYLSFIKVWNSFILQLGQNFPQCRNWPTMLWPLCTTNLCEWNPHHWQRLQSKYQLLLKYIEDALHPAVSNSLSGFNFLLFLFSFLLIFNMGFLCVTLASWPLTERFACLWFLCAGIKGSIIPRSLSKI